MPVEEGELLDAVRVQLGFRMPEAQTGVPAIAFDMINMSLDLDGVIAEAVALEDALGLSDDIFSVGATILLARLSARDRAIPVARYQLQMSQATRILGRLAVSDATTLEDIIELDAALTAARAWVMLEQLGLTDVVAALARYTQTAREAARLLDRMERFFGADISDGVDIAPMMQVLARLREATVEGVAIDADISPTMLLHVVSNDQLTLTHTQILQMIFDGTLDDTVLVEGLQFDPSGSVTTWCVNTRMGVTTEYRNYDFNSFAKLGREYVGAGRGGLFRLVGDDDDGEAIIANIQGGFLQMNASRFTGLQGVYLGIRGGGEFLLKLQTPAGQEYVYRITARDMETTKVWVGKGFRHRYVGYELESVGQDFDLESVEFVPMMAGRRV